MGDRAGVGDEKGGGGRGQRTKVVAFVTRRVEAVRGVGGWGRWRVRWREQHISFCQPEATDDGADSRRRHGGANPSAIAACSRVGGSQVWGSRERK